MHFSKPLLIKYSTCAACLLAVQRKLVQTCTRLSIAAFLLQEIAAEQSIS
jgi:hypothetical protein